MLFVKVSTAIVLFLLTFSYPSMALALDLSVIDSSAIDTIRKENDLKNPQEKVAINQLDQKLSVLKNLIFETVDTEGGKVTDTIIAQFKLLKTGQITEKQYLSNISQAVKNYETNYKTIVNPYLYSSLKMIKDQDTKITNPSAMFLKIREDLTLKFESQVKTKVDQFLKENSKMIQDLNK